MPQPEPKADEEHGKPARFERLLAEISALFINLPAEKIDLEIQAAQRRFCEVLDIDRSSLWIASERDSRIFELTHFIQPPALPAPLQRMNAQEFFPWSARQVLSGKTLVISKLSELPVEAAHDRENFRRYATQSTVLVPLSVGAGKPFGVLTFAATRSERTWTPREVHRFELVAQIFANALSRKRAEKALAERLQFEMMLADISARFINLPSDQLDSTIEDTQRWICERLGLELCVLWQWSDESAGSLTPTHYYSVREGPPPATMDAGRQFPWSWKQTKAGNIIAAASMAELPPEAARDIESYNDVGIKSMCMIPLKTGDGPSFGALGFYRLTTECTWPEPFVMRLQLIAQIFTNAISRKHSEFKLLQSEQRLRLITNALPVLISYVGADLRYRFNNEAYRTWFGVGPEEAMGRHIKEVIGERFFQRVKTYLEKALSGEHVRCTVDVEMANGRPLSIEAIYVPDFNERGSVRGLYVMALDVTERNLAQRESRRLQDELFHASRVTTMGELAGAIAHEINQPLCAIMSNAQAARRYLDALNPDVEEVKEILDDIAKEDTRASEVINRLRALLKNQKIGLELLDFNTVFQEVEVLLHSDAARRGIAFSLDLDPGPLLVQGDKIQLQQVVLNLVLNAFEAAKACRDAERRVLIRTYRRGDEILAAVIDNGVGIPGGETEKIFKAFYTTKLQGLGLGLSICRSIITSHQGWIWAENNPDRGATFYISIPSAAS